MKYEPFPLTPEQEKAFGDLLWPNPYGAGSIVAFHLGVDTELTRYLAVYRRVTPTVGGQAFWCDFAVFQSAGVDAETNALVWGDFFSTDPSTMKDDDKIAWGFHKFDGCRQFEMNVHEESDKCLLNTLSAVMTAVQIAGRYAGYREAE